MRTLSELLSPDVAPEGWVRAPEAFLCFKCEKECSAGEWISWVWENPKEWWGGNEPECTPCELKDKASWAMEQHYGVATSWNDIWNSLFELDDYTVEWWTTWSAEGHKKVEEGRDYADWVIHRTALSLFIQKYVSGSLPGRHSDMEDLSENEEETLRHYIHLDEVTQRDLELPEDEYTLWTMEVAAAAISEIRKKEKIDSGNPTHPYVEWLQNKLQGQES